MDKYHGQSNEAYWQELKAKQFPHAMPFNRLVFNAVVKNFRENQGLTKLDFVLDCLDKDAESSSFEHFLRSFTPPDGISDFADGYTSVIVTLISAQLLALYGIGAVEKYLDDVDDVLRVLVTENIHQAARAMKTDPSGSQAAMSLMEKLTTSSNREYFVDAVRSAYDTFMSYSAIFDKFVDVSAVGEKR